MSYYHTHRNSCLPLPCTSRALPLPCQPNHRIPAGSSYTAIVLPGQIGRSISCNSMAISPCAIPSCLCGYIPACPVPPLIVDSVVVLLPSSIPDRTCCHSLSYSPLP